MCLTLYCTVLERRFLPPQLLLFSFYILHELHRLECILFKRDVFIWINLSGRMLKTLFSCSSAHVMPGWRSWEGTSYSWLKWMFKAMEPRCRLSSCHWLLAEGLKRPFLPSGSSRHLDHTSWMLLQFCSFSSIFRRKSVNRPFTWGLTSSFACLVTLIDLIHLLSSLFVTRCSGVISLTQLVCMSSMSSAAFVSGDTFADISCWCSFTVRSLEFLAG